jgi:hypothetical protein
MLPPVKSD